MTPSENNKEWKDWKRQQQTRLTIQLEEINKKILAKERRLKRYCDRIKQYNIFQNKRKFYFEVSRENIKTMNNQM